MSRYNYPTSRSSSSSETREGFNADAIPMSRGDESGFYSSTATVIPTVDIHRRTTSQYEQQQSEKQLLRQKDEQLEKLWNYMEREKMASPKMTDNDHSRKSSNTYHIDKNERMKISRRIAKLDSILSKKAANPGLNKDGNAEYDLASSTSDYPILNREAVFDSPPPPYSYS